MIISITGTPRTGKTSVAKALARRLGWRLVGLNQLAQEKKLYLGYDKARKSRIVDLRKLRAEVTRLSKKHKNLILESHYSHDMPCDIVVILRANPGELRKRMRRAGWPKRKIEENIEAEIMEVVKGEALVKGILVDDKGARFVGEDNYGIWIGKEIIRRHPVSYLLIDQPIWDSLHEKSKGYLVVKAQADSIAELAKALNINLDVLQNTVNFYNEHAAKGQDPAFLKDEHYVVPLKQGPFRALDFSAAQVHLLTTGGLRINSKCNVLDAQGKPVPGLYAAGRNAFAVSAEHYPASGSSLGEGMIFGRIAGKTVAAEKAWDKKA